jgi:HK97 family phage major capsid protein
MSLDTMENDLRSFCSRHTKAMNEAEARLLCLEQRATAPNGGGFSAGSESIGAIVANSEGYKALASGARKTGAINVGNIHAKTAIVNATGQNQPLVQDYRVPGIIRPVAQQRLTVRDLLPSYPAPSNLIQFARESSSTNNAAPQTGGSPNSGENAVKAESAIAFALSNAPVQTLAHWIPASRQILDDAATLQAYLNNRLIFMLKYEEEQQLLNGDGTGNNLSGLVLNATTYDTSYTDPTSDSFIDVIGHAIAQVNNNSNLDADGIVLNNLDWAKIQLIKNTLGNYVYSDPHSATGARLWGLPVVPTKSMPRSQFLVGAFRMAAAIWDRNDATVQISLEHADFWVRNMAALLAEERLALTTFMPLALVAGGFPFGS